MTPKQYIDFHKNFCNQMVEITEKKNHDYSSGEDAFNNFKQIGHLVGPRAGNSAGTGPIDIIAIGFLTRMSDKFSRIGSFVSKGELLVKDESVADTLLDLANYCALFAGYLADQAAEQRKES